MQTSDQTTVTEAQRDALRERATAVGLIKVARELGMSYSSLYQKLSGYQYLRPGQAVIIQGAITKLEVADAQTQKDA